ncbi:DUF2000 domain-containing protein [Streptomyces sp. NPDC051315]|uniref:DUF2000 domain-containing protein n=1 Tax=Streptomyces sp. NPDC051315 TaxID=3365650 RepID=UPI00378AB48D
MTTYVPSVTPASERAQHRPARVSVERMVIVVNEELPPGHLANAAAVAGLIAGAKMPHLLGADLVDADGLVHTGTCTTGLPILRAPSAELVCLRARAAEYGLGVCAFPLHAQTTNSYEKLASLVRRTPTHELAYAALTIYGSRKGVDSITGSLPLVR